MSSNDSVNVKWNHKGTFRRFQIPRSGEIYMSLLAKINAVVPNFAGKLAWKDEDGDQIVFSSNLELSEAVSLPINQNILRIFTIETVAEMDGTEEAANKGKTEEKERHFGVTCDSCEVGLYGIRYKCAVCDDFDLCEKCEKKGLHAEHPLIRYASPRTPYLDDFMRRRRHCRRFGVHGSTRSPFMAEGLFGHCQNATATVNTAARAAAMASQQAAYAANQHAIRHAANVAAAFNKRAHTTAPDGAPAADGSQQLRDSVAQGMEFLKEVGAQVQQALANFGIDVDVDVQNGGVTEKIPKTNEKPEEEKQSENKEKEKDAEKRKSDETLETADQEKKDTEDVSVPMKKMHISEPTIDMATMDTAAAANDASAPPLMEETPILVDVDSEVLVDIHGDGDADSWTVMDSRETEQTPPAIVPTPPATPQDPPTTQPSSVYPQLPQEENKCQAGTPFVVPPPGQHNPHCFFIHPDQHVALCVSQLEGMGFDNCNGWLTKLSAMFNGNILGVIEGLGEDPVYAERLRRA